MNLKSLSPIFAGVALAIGANSVVAESSISSNRAIFCKNSNGMLTTMARTVESEDFPIFHWRAESLPESFDLQQLCDSVSTKLDNYLAQGHPLSSFGSYEQVGLPTICAEAQPDRCSLVLFTLAPTDNPINQSNKILEEILDAQLKQEKQVSNIRGVQAFAYKINNATFFKLLMKTF